MTLRGHSTSEESSHFLGVSPSPPHPPSPKGPCWAKPTEPIRKPQNKQNIHYPSRYLSSSHKTLTSPQNLPMLKKEKGSALKATHKIFINAAMPSRCQQVHRWLANTIAYWLNSYSFSYNLFDIINLFMYHFCLRPLCSAVFVFLYMVLLLQNWPLWFLRSICLPDHNSGALRFRLLCKSF